MIRSPALPMGTVLGGGEVKQNVQERGGSKSFVFTS